MVTGFTILSYLLRFTYFFFELLHHPETWNWKLETKLKNQENKKKRETWKIAHIYFQYKI